ncbi:sensor histidine kinase [Saccharibacillus endophyticus]|uniref:histidine kinase n=1 Tax=Saccharibacillus endophyticus TaxID=2060666 RepID=A0ABQ2A819_9BACL|nr:sensor histidine kinase [Saccharibacillus endophyticus]GGH85923.1 sensor histidine kinase YxjM [Saccharibacillus endophyticus]
MTSLPLRRGQILSSIVLLYLFARLLPDSNSARWASAILFLVFIAGLAISPRIKNPNVRFLLFGGLYAASVAYWLAFGHDTSLLLILQGFLVSYTALLLVEPASAVLAIAIVTVTFILQIVYEGASWESLLRQDLFIYVGLYALLRMIRINRSKQREQQQHAEELKIIHAELADTHAKLQRAHEELEQATVQSLRYAVLEERSRIARDIHDSIGHRLTSVIVQLQALPYVLKSDPAESERIVRTLLEVARSCMQEVRSVVHEMGTDESGAGIVSLRSLVQQTSVVPGAPQIILNIEENAGRQQEWPPQIAAALYRCLQEALTNTIRHAQAHQVEITIKQSGSNLALSYRDDGILKPGEPLQEGFGLGGIRKRCRDVGGECMIEAQEPHGIAIDIALPLAIDRDKGDEQHG